MGADKRFLKLRVDSERDSGLMPAGEYFFPPDQSARVGRSTECEVVVRHKRISRLHGTFAHDESGWHYASFGTNGSFVDGIDFDHLPVSKGLEIELGGSGYRVICELVSADGVPEGSSFSNASSSIGSITGILPGFAAGDENCTRELWARCFATIVRLARQNLSGTPKRLADEEDIAASVFESLFFGAVEGKFPDLNDRESLWRLIAVMTRRKAADYVHHQRRAKRGGGKVRGDSIFPGKPGGKSSGFDGFVGEQPSPMAVAMIEENLSELLDRLPDEEHRQIALLRLEGYKTAEVAEELSLSLRSVERRLHTIRTLWTQLLQLAEPADGDETSDR